MISGEMESIDVAKAFERTQQLIRKKRGRQMYDSLMRYAAFLTLPLLMISLTLGYLYFSGPEAVDCYAEVTAAKGSVIRYELPDHSVAWLNAGSTVKHQEYEWNYAEVVKKKTPVYETEPDSVYTLDEMYRMLYGTLKTSSRELPHCLHRELLQGKNAYRNSGRAEP